MAAAELQEFNSSLPDQREEELSHSSPKRGGWITFPFLTGAVICLTLGFGGCLANLIVYLIGEFNVKRIDAAQISNVVNGCTSLSPVIGAILADSFLGCFSVISISSFVALLGIVIITLTSTLKSLRPPSCEETSILCKSASSIQIGVLYTGIALASIGSGGTRFTLATMGANQFVKQQDQDIFFNWYFFAFFSSSMIAGTAIVYIQDNISWGLGYGLSLVAGVIGLLIFLCGKCFYCHDKPQGSPFVSLARVIFAFIKKRKVFLSSRSDDYYYGHDRNSNMVVTTPEKSFRFLNKAAVITEGDLRPDGSVAKPWNLCTIQQVEDFKALIRIFPLWSSSIFLSTPIGIQSSLTILQTLTMNRHIGSHFKIPAGSMLVIAMISTSISLASIDRCLYPLWQKLTHKYPTPLQRIGVGHILNILSMAISALVELKRLSIVHNHNLQDKANSEVPMSVLWLFPQLILVGIGEAFHFPGQVALYYQEFPISLKSTATAMIAVVIGIAFYLSTAVIDLFRRVTGWLPDDVNKGRLDNVYWVVVLFGVLNFGYYVVCAKFYKYQNAEHKRMASGNSVSSDI